jgi:hypothetical protein
MKSSYFLTITTLREEHSTHENEYDVTLLMSEQGETEQEARRNAQRRLRARFSYYDVPMETSLQQISEEEYYQLMKFLPECA